ncbi:glycosyl transferase, group 1 [Nitrobacter hamburgensis X14]|uniref:Glycosyl transferase, group 1 n=1 Tax=Nitrobacter hamburgensis (strain DSM 10229 / NCIMB 13809 / X14) TaxID=323097 RepID=Q1QJQ4_NITHX|nr:glycosyltransferase family 4 protein [Nitrobacter hamburgensis]ABE63543.1 glycosyl transferase, group 1 [Nitrobacter hamburgensis X14]
MATALKIGFVTERLLLGFGVDLVVHQYASFLAGRGYDVKVYCLRHDTSVERPYKVVDLSKPEVLTPANSMSRYILNFATFFNSQNIDVWIVNTSPFYDVMPLLLQPAIAIEYGAPPSRFFSPEIGRNLDASVAYRFQHVFTRLRAQDQILCISRSIQNWLPNCVHPSSEIHYLGCDHYARPTTEQVLEFRRSLKFDDGVIVLWVGRVQIENDEQPYKGFVDFVELAERAIKAERSLCFVVVGRGGEAEEHFLRIRGIIPRLNLPDNQMGAAFASSDLFVSTSLWEGFNLPLLEAQWQGTPVLAYRHGPHPEVVCDGVTGILVDNRKDMFEALLTLARDANKRESLASKTRAFAADFSWGKSARGLEEAILRAASVAARCKANRSAIDSSRVRKRLFVLQDTYARFGLRFLVKRIVLFVRTCLVRALKRGGKK